jgi:hypothetical protein
MLKIHDQEHERKYRTWKDCSPTYIDIRCPVISAIRKAAVPITGGIRAAPVHDTDVIAPVNMDLNPSSSSWEY